MHGLDLRGGDAGPEDVASRKEMGELLQRAVEALPDIYQDVFMLRMVDGLFVYLVGAILVMTSPTKQRLGYRVTGTVVVRRGFAPEPATPSAA